MDYETIEHDPFEKLFTSKADVNRAMAEFLLPYLRIDPDTYDVVFTEPIKVQDRILLYLLAIRLLNRMHKWETEGATPKELAIGLNANPNTIRPLLMMLLEKHLIAQDKKGRYFVHANALKDVKAHILRRVK